MKRKELTELRAKEAKDLVKLVSQKKLDARKSKVRGEKGAKNLRRDIAQIMSIIKEREIADKLNETK